MHPKAVPLTFAIWPSLSQSLRSKHPLPSRIFLSRQQQGRNIGHSYGSSALRNVSVPLRPSIRLIAALMQTSRSFSPAPAQLAESGFQRSVRVVSHGTNVSAKQQIQRPNQPSCCRPWELSVRSSSRHAAIHQHSRWSPKTRATQPAGSSSSAERARADYMADPPAGGRDFFNWVLDLPWQRVAVWLVVVFAGLQLREFFGVSSCCLHCRAALFSHACMHAMLPHELASFCVKVCFTCRGRGGGERGGNWEEQPMPSMFPSMSGLVIVGDTIHTTLP